MTNKMPKVSPERLAQIKAQSEARRQDTAKKNGPVDRPDLLLGGDVDEAIDRFSRVLEESRTTPKAYAYRRGLIYGPAGVGKTSLLASAAFDPRTSPIALLDMEGGAMSALGIDTTLCTPIAIRDWQDYTDALAFFKNEKHPYKTIGVDSGTEAHIYALLDVIERAFTGKIQDEDDTKSKREDNLKAFQDDYGRALNMMRRFIREFTQLDMHVFFTALAKTENEPKEGPVKKPMLFGSFADEAVGMFETCVYLEVERSKTDGGFSERRNLILQNVPAVRARVKVPWNLVIPNQIQNLKLETGMTQLFDALEGKPKQRSSK